jgi:hypothetical protein
MPLPWVVSGPNVRLVYRSGWTSGVLGVDLEALDRPLDWPGVGLDVTAEVLVPGEASPVCAVQAVRAAARVTAAETVKRRCEGFTNLLARGGRR